jgi:hypothetical protein
MRSLAAGFDKDGSLLPRVGVELQLPALSNAERVFEALTSDGLSDGPTCARLLGWHGHRIDHAGEASPAGFGALKALRRGRVIPAVVRRIHHVKLTLEPGRPVTAKAYLGARYKLTL